MMYAKDEEGNKILPQKGINGNCFLCGESLVAKCGKVNVWHWAHKKNNECDDWYEPESEWHRSWKELLIKEVCEVKVGNHFADIKLNRKEDLGLVIELQHSSISKEVIAEREKHYGHMFWLFDARNFKIEFRKDMPGALKSFRWKYPHKTLSNSLKPLFFDIGDGFILRIEKIYFKEYCGGFGKVITKNNFIKTYFSNYLKIKQEE